MSNAISIAANVYQGLQVGAGVAVPPASQNVQLVFQMNDPTILTAGLTVIVSVSGSDDNITYTAIGGETWESGPNQRDLNGVPSPPGLNAGLPAKLPAFVRAEATASTLANFGVTVVIS